MRSSISGSMEPYARAYLHLLWGLAAGAHSEVFVFGTRLTRLTRGTYNNPDLALERAAALMPDWSGGTRVDWALHEFMNLHGRSGIARGAVVPIVSEGWGARRPECARPAVSYAEMPTGSSEPTPERPRQASLRSPAAWQRPFCAWTRSSAATRSTRAHSGCPRAGSNTAERR